MFPMMLPQYPGATAALRAFAARFRASWEGDVLAIWSSACCQSRVLAMVCQGLFPWASASNAMAVRALTAGTVNARPRT